MRRVRKIYHSRWRQSAPSPFNTPFSIPSSASCFVFNCMVWGEKKGIPVLQHVVTNIQDISPRQLCTIYILLQVTERLPLFSCSETPTASFSEILLGISSLKLRQIFAGEHIQSNHEIKLLSAP